MVGDCIDWLETIGLAATQVQLAWVLDFDGSLKASSLKRSSSSSACGCSLKSCTNICNSAIAIFEVVRFSLCIKFCGDGAVLNGMCETAMLDTRSQLFSIPLLLETIFPRALARALRPSEFRSSKVVQACCCGAGGVCWLGPQVVVVVVTKMSGKTHPTQPRENKQRTIERWSK